MCSNIPPTPLQIIDTLDGSHTLYLPSLNEHYHSTNGAIQESQHVFIGAGYRTCSPRKKRLLEIGFGTGLNALLTWSTLLDEEHTEVSYYTVERHPLPYPLVEQLNFGKGDSPTHRERFLALHRAPWDKEVALDTRFTLHKLAGAVEQLTLPEQIDLVYFDAFAPDKQPEIWSSAIFQKIYERMNPGGVLTTYCAKGAVRRTMQAVGFSVERLPGPPGKREMLRATVKE